MSLFDLGLRPLDCHAHLAPDVTDAQVANLEGANVVGVTRSLAEAAAALAIGHRDVVWGCGTHPGDAGALEGFSAQAFADLMPRFAVIGEIGLDGRAGRKDLQRAVLADILRLVTKQPILLSIHSAGATVEVVELLEQRPHSGAVMHWFLGDQDTLRRAIDLGAYFSINGAMADEKVGAIPKGRVLPETDFPAAGKRAGRRPGDTLELESRLGQLWSQPTEDVRRQLYRNLRDVASRSGAIERLPERFADVLLYA
jgi:TatD DNase family protein